MNNLNSVLIEGNLVEDPEVSYTPEGSTICSFKLASNRYFKQDEETQKEVSYFEVTTEAGLAKICAEYLKKDRGVRVVGRLATRPDATDKVYIMAEHVEFKPQLKTAKKGS